MSNLPCKEQNNLITRIKQFFRKLFYKPEKNIIKEEIIEPVNTNNFKEISELKVDSTFSKQKEKESFIESIEKNPNLLYGLSLERLKKLEDFYDELIERDKLELEKLISNQNI